MKSHSLLVVLGVFLGFVLGWAASDLSDQAEPVPIEGIVGLRHDMDALNREVLEQGQLLRYLAERPQSEPSLLPSQSTASAGAKDWEEIAEDLNDLIARLGEGSGRELAPLQKDTAALLAMMGPDNDSKKATRHMTELLFGFSPAAVAPRLGTPDEVVEDGLATRWVYILDGSKPIRMLTCTFIDSVLQGAEVEVIQ